MVAKLAKLLKKFPYNIIQESNKKHIPIYPSLLVKKKMGLVNEIFLALSPRYLGLITH